MSDQKRISPYNIKTISSRQVMRIKKMSIKGLFVFPIPNSPNWHNKNCMTDSEEKTNEILGGKGLMHRGSSISHN